MFQPQKQTIVIVASQAAALLIGIVVFLALVLPGYARYTLFGGGALIAVNAMLLGVIDGLLPHLLR